MKEANDNTVLWNYKDIEIEFSSPLSLEQCIERLKQAKHGGILDSTRVYTKIIDSNQAYFEMKRWFALNCLARVSGDLTRTDNETTIVYGKASLNKRIFVFALLAVFVSIIMAFSMLLNGEIFTLIFVGAFVLVAGINVLQLFQTRRNLLLLLEATLQAP